MHYHGTPITPRERLHELAGRCFCVRFGEHRDVEVCHEIGQSVMLDNGAYSFWRKGVQTDWPAFYEWVEPWLDFQTTWAVIPDVIDGGEEQNDALLAEWPHGDRGAPVWHMHESFERLERLCSKWSRVCIGSSGRYADPSSFEWTMRMHRAMDAICGDGPAPVWLHMLRAMKQAINGPYPFASADSTNIARNHASSTRSVQSMVTAIDSHQAPARWRKGHVQLQLAPRMDVQ